ncbi:MAG: hypothetical protein RL702_3090 [Pseudomonadota bacterium]
MAIFVPRSQLTESTFASAPSFAGTETNWFPQTAILPGSEGVETGGYFVAKIGQDLVGSQISALPDVIRIDFGADASAIVDEAYLAHIFVYGHFVIRDKHGQIIDEGVSLLAGSGFQSDQILPALYPEDQVQSNFCKITVPALPETVTNLAGDTTRWDQLYIVVDGSRTTGWMERYGLESEDEGRFLLAVGQVEGQRDTKWGDWVNDISFWGGSVPLTDPWYRPDDSVFAGVDSFSTGSDDNAARAGVSGLNFGDDGTVTWQLGSGGPNIFAMMTQSIQASLGLGADYGDAVNHATGGVLGDLGVEAWLTATEAFASDPAISAVAGLASQAKTAVSVKTALVSFNQRNLEIFQGGVDALISGQPFDPFSIDRDLQNSTGQLYTDLALAFSGVTGSAVVAAYSSYQRISNWLQHSTASLTATFARVRNDALVTLPAGHNDTYLGDSFANRINLGDGDDGTYGAGGNDDLQGGAGKDLLMGATEDDQLNGGPGNDTLNGGANIDTAVFSGAMAAYMISQPSTGVFIISGPDGTDTLTAVEYARFDDALVRLLPGIGVTVNFNTDQPAVYQGAMNAIRDFDGNELGGNGGWSTATGTWTRSSSTAPTAVSPKSARRPTARSISATTAGAEKPGWWASTSIHWSSQVRSRREVHSTASAGSRTTCSSRTSTACWGRATMTRMACRRSTSS